MILLNGFPDRIVLGAHGITPAQIVALGDEPSPLLNDIDAGDESTTLVWVLLPPLPASGTTDADDLGYYALTGAADGTYTQNYRVLALTAGGTAAASESTITTVVGGVFLSNPTAIDITASGFRPRVSYQY
jgi:hypothetical protein